MPDKNFLETYPLYKKHPFEIPQTMEHLPKPPVSFVCERCGNVQTFVMTNEYFAEFGNIVNIPTENNAVRATYCCVGCQANERHFFIKLDNEGGYILKLGQYPAWEIKGDRTVEKLLGAHKDYLRRGLICESQGYGIGAFAYYRRITEEIIDGLIGDIQDLIPDSEQAAFAAAYEKVKTTHQTSEKIALVKDLLPATLEIEGMNPLGIIYKALSEGLHAESDDRCIEYAEAVRESLVFLASQVSETKNRKRVFTEKMRGLLSRG